MPITAIDPRSAPVVIDVQKGIVALPTVHPAQTVTGNVIRLLGTFRSKGLPVVVVRVGWSADFGDVAKTRNEHRPVSLGASLASIVLPKPSATRAALTS